MFISQNLVKTVLIAAIILLVTGCSESNGKAENETGNTAFLTVYKSAQCGCCGKWISHMRGNGFKLVSRNQNNLSDIKEKVGIQKSMRSCHTSITDDGFVFEGHIPAKFIKKFLAEKPFGARGLAVPAMPTGTPGMEFGDLLQPYKIYLLKTDGSIEIYAEVNTTEEQI